MRIWKWNFHKRSPNTSSNKMSIIFQRYFNYFPQFSTERFRYTSNTSARLEELARTETKNNRQLRISTTFPKPLRPFGNIFLITCDKNSNSTHRRSLSQTLNSWLKTNQVHLFSLVLYFTDPKITEADKSNNPRTTVLYISICWIR